MQKPKKKLYYYIFCSPEKVDKMEELEGKAFGTSFSLEGLDEAFEDKHKEVEYLSTLTSLMKHSAHEFYKKYKKM